MYGAVDFCLDFLKDYNIRNFKHLRSARPLYSYISTHMLYSVRSSVASSRWLAMYIISSSAGHDDGVINCPVGDTINGPASLEYRCIF